MFWAPSQVVGLALEWGPFPTFTQKGWRCDKVHVLSLIVDNGALLEEIYQWIRDYWKPELHTWPQ